MIFPVNLSYDYILKEMFGFCPHSLTETNNGHIMCKECGDLLSESEIYNLQEFSSLLSSQNTFFGGEYLNKIFNFLIENSVSIKISPSSGVSGHTFCIEYEEDKFFYTKKTDPTHLQIIWASLILFKYLIDSGKLSRKEIQRRMHVL